MVYWDADANKDLIVGQSDGTIKLFLNTGTDGNPTFDAGRFLQVGSAGSKVNIAVGARATPAVVDWNNDGMKDLVVGAIDGRIRLYINSGSDTAPDFLAVMYAQAGGGDLAVSTGRSSPAVVDLDADGMKDLLIGDTSGQLRFYSNVGTDAAPSFGGYVLVEADGVPIDLAGSARSRPFVGDWTGDGLPDILVGGSDGQVHLFLGVPSIPTVSEWGLLVMSLLVLTAGTLLFTRRRRMLAAGLSH